MARVKRKVDPKTEAKWEEVLEYFLLFKKSQGLSKRTLSDYKSHVEKFFTFAVEGKMIPMDSFGNYDALRVAVMNYFADSSSLSPATFNTRRKCLKAFFNWTVEEEYLPAHPMEGIKKMKEDHKPRSVDEETIKKLLQLPDQKTFSGLRDYALLVFTMDTGIRPSEAFGLRIVDINEESYEVTVPAHVAKTRVARTLPISIVSLEAIKRLISVRHPSWKDDVPVFCTENGTPLNRWTWARRMRKYSEELGVKVQPYALRHTFALMYLRQGGNAFALQKTLGHTNLTMTKRYVALAEADLHEQHSLASPVMSLVVSQRRVRGIKD